MGNLQTVVPCGPFDTARNPALLAQQTSVNSTGLFFNYVTHIAKENSASGERHEETFSPSPTTSTSYIFNTEIEDPQIKAYNIYLANSTKLNNSAFGFAFTNNGDDLYSVEKREISTITSLTPSTYASGTSEKTEKSEYNPAFIFSAGFNLSGSSSIGFQILAKYKDSTEKKEYYANKVLPAPVYEKSEKITKETQKLSGELGFGYFFKANDSEIGFQIKSGDFSWIKKSISADTYRILTGENLRVNDDITLNGKHTSGPSITAGGYKRLNSFFAIAFESRLTIQNSFTNKELEVDDDQSTATKVKVKESSQRDQQSILFNGGIEFDILKDLSFNCGLGYLKVNVENCGSDGNGDYKQEYNIKYFLLTAGLDYILTKNVEFAITAAAISYSIDLNSYGQAEDKVVGWRQETSQTAKSKGYYLQTGLGVSLSF
ncbi:MAG: hypothetical protein V1874_10540 [Spirochaetota bacterium]